MSNLTNYPSPWENEPFSSYRSRIYKMKQSGELKVSWVGIADMFYKEYNVLRDESTWRKEAKDFLISNIESITDCGEDENVQDEDQTLFQYRKEAIKMADIKNQERMYLRRIAREESIIEIAKYTADKMAESNCLQIEPWIELDENKEAEAIAVISDWHYGIEINNYWNTFNPDICRIRVAEYLGKLIETCELFGINHIHLVNLGDLIAGRIHATIRLESREDVISQILHVSEILTNFINELTLRGYTVDYYDCLDNHSRLEPIKTDSLDLESLARIIPWYLKERFKLEPKFKIHHNKYDTDIIMFNVLGDKYTVGAVHGDKDRPHQVINNLTMMTNKNIDMVLTAHLHHWAGNESNRVIHISNGSLMGTDTYAKNLRLDSEPSQNIIIATKGSVCDFIRRVPLHN